jgi:hypothetical protein
MSAARQNSWKKNFVRMISEAQRNVGGEIFLSKNPPTTFRIKEILEIYPQAKFIFLEREPYRVLSSFRLFMQKVVQGVGFHKVDNERFNEYMIDLYQRLYKVYNEQKSLIPKSNLFEIDFKDFTKDPIENIRSIYNQFGFSFSDDIESRIKSKLDEFENHEPGDYTIPGDIVELVKTHLEKIPKESISTE